LREAVLAANESPGADTINLFAGAYVIQRVGTGEDAGLRGDIDIDGNVNIRGAGADVTEVDGRQIERVFEVRPDVNAKISGLTVTGGATYGVPGGPVADGGGILNRGDLTLEAVLITGNRADRAAYGGGIHNARTLTLRNSTIRVYSRLRRWRDLQRLRHRGQQQHDHRQRSGTGPRRRPGKRVHGFSEQRYGLPKHG
jgi:hypothetical protein